MASNESNMADIKGIIDTVITLNTRVNDLETCKAQIIDKLTLLELKSIALEARSRRNNLIFWWFRRGVQIIRSFLRDSQGIQDQLAIARAHRLGRFDRTKERRIIVRFRDYSDTEAILSNTTRLRGTNYGVNRDYPPEIAAVRKTLLDDYKDLKKQNPIQPVRILYPSKLVVGRTVIRDMFPNGTVL